ncbi:hypothetical protein CsatB_006425 [Cannabis sativa]
MNLALWSSIGVKREYTPKEKEAEAAVISYKVVGPVERSDRVFKPYEPIFAIVRLARTSSKSAMETAFLLKD